MRHRRRGTLRVAMLLVDFPDAHATHSTQQEMARGNTQLTRDFLEDVSYGAFPGIHHGPPVGRAGNWDGWNRDTSHASISPR